MAKPLRVLGITVALVFALVISAIIAIVIFFDANAYRSNISEGVKNATGRDLKIEGEIELSLWPWIGAKIGAMELSNAPGFGDTAFARIENAEVKVKLLPLLNGVMETKAVTLNGLNLNLTINKEGISNWQDLSQNTPADAADTNNSSAPQGDNTSNGAGIAALAIGGLNINNAAISYDDQTTNSRYNLHKLNLTTGAISFNQPIAVELMSNVTTTQPQLAADISLKADVLADFIHGIEHKIKLQQLAVNFKSDELESQGTIALGSEIAINTAAESYTLNNTRLDASIKNLNLPQGEAKIALQADLTANTAQQTASINNLNTNAYGLDISGQISASQILATPNFKAEIKFDQFNPTQLLDTLGIEKPVTTDTQALSTASAQLSVAGTTNSIDIHTLNIALDETHITGNGHIALDSNKAIPAVAYTLDIDAIDIDRYLPPPNEADNTQPVAVTPATAGAAAAELPMETLRALDINGTLKIRTLKAMNLHISDIKSQLTANSGIIQLSPISAQLYKGQYQGNMKLDARGNKPKIALNESLSGIDTGPLLKDLMADDIVRGKANLSAKIDAVGSTPEEITKTLNGNVKFSLDNGALKGVDIPVMLYELDQLIENNKEPAQLLLALKPLSDKLQQANADGSPKLTKFDELNGTLNITNGNVQNNDLKMRSAYLRASGAGSANLVSEKIDYRIKASLDKAPQGYEDRELKHIRAKTIPIIVSGSFQQPSFNVDKDFVKEYLRQRTKEKLEEKKDEKREELKQKVEDKLKDKLRGLFR